ncbi:MAG: M56 family metallopeptidase [Verrucomicrobiota bacterium]
MTGMLIFSVVAAALVFHAGRKDAARDPRLTTVALVLLALFPLLTVTVPKIGVLSVDSGTEAHDGFSWQVVVLKTWMIGSGVALLRLLAAAVTLGKWRRDSRWLENIGRIEIRELITLNGPVAVGIFRKTIFVPESWRQWSEATRQIVIAHETGHHQRHDPLWRWFAGIACAVNWYNPLVWWMSRRLALQCEHACDANVMHQGVDACTYARVLCDLAEDTPATVHAIAMAQRSSLELRVARLVRPKNARSAVGVLLTTLWIMSAAVVAAMLGPKNTPENHFSPAEIQTRWSANPFPSEP